jgi:hypothetical protein
MMREFRLAEWLVQPELNTIVQAGQTLRLEPKVMALRLYLREHVGVCSLCGEIAVNHFSSTFPEPFLAASSRRNAALLLR